MTLRGATFKSLGGILVLGLATGVYRGREGEYAEVGESRLRGPYSTLPEKGIKPMADMPTVKAFTIRIISGQYAGRYLGMHFGGGMVSNPEVQKNPPVNLPGMNYGAWVQERAATRFLEGNAGPVLVALNQLGYKAELIKVQG